MELAPIVKILPLALEDSQYCLDTIFEIDSANKKMVQMHYRNCYRTFYATVEMITTAYQDYLKSKKISIRSPRSAKERFEATISEFIKLHELNISDELASDGFTKFNLGIKTRNRLAHPKSLECLTISESEKIDLTGAIQFYIELQEKCLKGAVNFDGTLL